MKLSPKSLIIVLLLSIPFNYILVEGIGNVYLSTIIIFIEFFGLFLLKKGNILLKQNVLFAILIFLITLIVTVINVIYYDANLVKSQITNTIIYFQTLLVFIIASYFYDKVAFNFFIKSFLIIVFFASVRVIIEEPNHILKLSTRWDERISALFIGGANNYALFLGIAFTISFFYVKNKTIRVLSCLYFLIMIILTMSRGALLGVILTLFITSLYDTNRATFKLLVKYTTYSIFSGLVVLYSIGKIDEVLEKIEKRFFSLFTGEMGINDFFSARGDLLEDIFSRLSESSIFQILFGHGNGGIDFFNSASNQHYETSHNLLVDILYRNGIFLTVLYISIFTYLSWMFFKKRKRIKLVLFGIFVFFHLELLVNPVLFAAQVGWVYAIFMVYFLKQDQLQSL